MKISQEFIDYLDLVDDKVCIILTDDGDVFTEKDLITFELKDILRDINELHNKIMKKYCK